MLNNLNFISRRKILIVYVILSTITLAVFWQVHHFSFVNIDDYVYVKENIHILSGITPDGARWAFTTAYAEFWHPLTWISLMLDYQLFGLNAGGYHVANLILHILSTLLLFWLFHRMTGSIWQSAFVAAFFAIHPLHVESVAWIAERKDVLSGFFSMLTLCLYVFYTEKPVLRRYLIVLFSFVCALMSKPIAVTLPLIMVLLDYWPLNRFAQLRGNLLMWQTKEKIPFFILSIAFSIITLIAQPDHSAVKVYPLALRLANALIAFITYLEKTFWPFNLAVFYPFPMQINLWQIFGSLMVIIIITLLVISRVKSLPQIFVGWFWYSIMILPVIGIIPVGIHAMADRYHYLSSIGLAVMLAWGIPDLFKREGFRKKLSFTAGIAFLAIMGLLAKQQCSYWENSSTLFSHALQSTKNNYFAHDGLGIALREEGKIREAIEQFSKAITTAPDYLVPYVNRGNAYEKIGQYQKAMDDYNKVISIKSTDSVAYHNRAVVYLKSGQYDLALQDLNKAVFYKPDNAETFNRRAYAYERLGHYQKAIEDYSHATQLKEDYAEAYNSRGILYGILGQYQSAIEDFNKAIKFKDNYADAYNNRGFTYYKLGQNQRAIEDYNRAILLKSDYADAYRNRAVVYLQQGNSRLGFLDAQKLCLLGNCEMLKSATKRRYCR